MYLTFFNGLFKPVSVEEMSIRSANLSLIKLIIPVMGGPSQSFLASRFFGISFKTFQKVYSSLALATTLLVAIHNAAALVPWNGHEAVVRHDCKPFSRGRLELEYGTWAMTEG
jgi:hypothetical protein